MKSHWQLEHDEFKKNIKIFKLSNIIQKHSIPKIKKYLSPEIKAKRHRISVANWQKQNPEKRVYKQAKYLTKKKGLSFELTFDRFSEILHQPCNYCKENNPVNSVDRINSSLGYVEGNVQSLCDWCNKMKLNYTEDNFMSHIKKIYRNIK